MKKLLKAPELYLSVVLLACAIFTIWCEPKISNVRLIVDGVEEEATLPISEEIPDHRLFYVKMDVSNLNFSEYSFHVIPDDCLEKLSVNDEKVSLDAVPERCNYTRGMYLNSGIFPAAEDGTLHMNFALKDNGGPGGLSVEIYQNGFLWKLFQGLFTVVFLTLAFLMLRRYRVPIPFALLIVIATLCHVIYTEATTYTTRTHDVDGHVGYIEYIADHHRIPANDDCWSCYHPPVYYTMMAPVWAIANGVGFPPARAVQWATFILSFVLVATGIGVLRLLMNGPALGIASVLWAFFPSLFLISPRIGNDQLFFLAHVICLCASLSYMVKRKPAALVIGAIACWAAYWTKSTGFVTICTWLAGFVLGYFPRNRMLPKTEEWIGLLLMLGLGISILVKLWMGNALVGNAGGLNSRLLVDSDAVNFLYFDVPGFLSTVYTDAWNDEGGRQYFWNYLFKSALFGEFKIRTDTFGNWVASILNYSFFGLLIFGAVGFWKKKFDGRVLLLWVNGGLFLLALAVLRLKYPYSCSNDFRYILPILLSFVPYVGWGIFKENASLKWEVCGIACSAVFVISSCLLYLSL
ncbi:MAG: glycosyltransferase family 39 protein [Fibrobacter sp.]|nr:glycosyltransferase family 39 protein [Fibrobacter sp.]